MRRVSLISLSRRLVEEGWNVMGGADTDDMAHKGRGLQALAMTRQGNAENAVDGEGGENRLLALGPGSQ